MSGSSSNSGTSSSYCETNPLENAVLADAFCAFELPVTVNQARSVVSLTPNSLLVLERGTSSVILLYDTDGDAVPDSSRTLVQAPGLNHGLAIHSNYLYASSDTTVYRWRYNYTDDDNVEHIDPEPTVVITNINADGQGGAPFGHTTRTLAFDSVGRLYISVGSAGNVDQDSFRSRIRLFQIVDNDFPIDFLDGQVFADGLRNEVGLAFDKHNVLWGVENGADRLYRDDLGGDIHNDNPAEELNRFPEEQEESVGANATAPHYGYPYCWTEYKLPPQVGRGRGAGWAWPATFPGGVVYTDEQCQESFVPPSLAMQAHSAPLGITFYKYKPESERPAGCTGAAFPKSMNGFAFIAFHGSWNRDIPTGYKVVYVPMDENGFVATSNHSDPVDLLAHVPPNAKWQDGFRPVDVDFDACGRLLVSSDGTRDRDSGVYTGSKIVRIESLDMTNGSVAMPTLSPAAIDTEQTTSDVPSSTGSNADLATSMLPTTVPSDVPSNADSNAGLATSMLPTTGPSSSGGATAATLSLGSSSSSMTPWLFVLLLCVARRLMGW